jgi:hypothetical protein
MMNRKILEILIKKRGKFNRNILKMEKDVVRKKFKKTNNNEPNLVEGNIDKRVLGNFIYF